ncbi:MAG: hypothetical protein R3E84_06520 [Pseudomonadales bacterium]|nr:hypothetical protein [Pseudomonadales bacterium]
MKVLLWIVLVLVLVLGGAGVWLYLNSGSLLARAIEQYGSDIVGAPVRVGRVSLALDKGTGEISSLTVGQPGGYDGGNILSIGTTRLGIALDPDNGSNGVYHLTEMTVDSVALSVIARGRDTNVEAMANRVQQNAARYASGSDTAAGPEVRVIVDRLNLTGIRADVNSDLAGTMAVTVPDVRLKDVGAKEGGVTFAELANRIVRPISRSVTKELINQQIDVDAVKEKAKEKVKKKLDKEVKGLFDKLKDG